MHMTQGRERMNAPLWGLLTLVALFVSIYSVWQMWLSADSMRYALVSQQIASGKGVKSPIIQFRGLVPDSHGNVHFIEQPPLFPAILAVFGSVTHEKIWPGQMLNILCHLSITILSWLIAKKIVGNVVAFIVGLTVALSISLLGVCNFLWSEPLFITLILAAVYCLLSSRSSKHPGLWVLAAGVSASAAVATRYSGIAILPLFVVETGYLWKKKLPTKTSICRVLCLLLPIFTTAALLTRNKLLLGIFRGFHQAPVGRSIMSSVVGVVTNTLDELAIHGVGVELLRLIGLWEYRKLFLLPVVLILVLWLGLLLRRNRLREIFKEHHAGYDLILIFITGYALLINYGMFRYQPHFEGRFFAPLVPFLLILIVSLLNPHYSSLSNRFLKIERNVKTVILISLMFCSVIWFFKNTSRFFEKPGWVNRIDSSDVFCWVKSNISTQGTIATNRPFDVSFYGGYSTLNLPSRHWDRCTLIPENMREALAERMEQTRADHLLLFTDEDGLHEKHFGKFIAELSRREHSEPYVMVFECSDGVVYRLNR